MIYSNPGSTTGLPCNLGQLSSPFCALKHHHLFEEGEAQLGLGMCEVWVFWGLFHFVLGSLFMIIQTTSKYLNLPLLSWL